MAGSIALNTTDHPTLTQYLQNTSAGLFDYKAQQVAGKVPITGARAPVVIQKLTAKAPASAPTKPWLKEV